jgi:hypothetical protein
MSTSEVVCTFLDFRLPLTRGDIPLSVIEWTVLENIVFVFEILILSYLQAKIVFFIASSYFIAAILNL